MGETDPNVFIDHKDHNTLNNCKSNLRRCSRAENNTNRVMLLNKTGPSFKGVHMGTGNYKHKFVAFISVGKKAIYLGTFNTDIEAARAYNEAAIKHHGEFAQINTNV